MKNFYEILEVPKNASRISIMAVYKKKAILYHPDTTPIEDKDFAANKFKEINEANRVLSDPKLRAEYDQQLALPRPDVSHTRINFGALLVGEQKTQRFQVNNLGGPIAKLAFDTSQPDHWFSVSPQWQGDFPVDVDIHIDTGTLSEGQSYDGWVDVSLDEITARVDLLLSIKSSKTSSRIFTFQSGESIIDTDELPSMCERYWKESLQYLYDDKFFKNWFIELRRNDLLAKLEVSKKEKNPNIGLDKFIRSISANIIDPSLIIECDTMYFEDYDSSDYLREANIRLYNSGPGWCYGNLDVINATWLSISQKEFALAPCSKLDIHLKPIAYELIREGRYSATLVINSNSQNNSHTEIVYQLTTPL